MSVSPNVLVNEERKGEGDRKRQNEMGFFIMRQKKAKKCDSLPFPERLEMQILFLEYLKVITNKHNYFGQEQVITINSN